MPPKQTSPAGQFGPEDFTVSDDGSTDTCPAGETSQYRQYEAARHGTSYRFATKIFSLLAVRSRQDLPSERNKRRARFRGLGRVLGQQLMGAMTASLDRLIRSLAARAPLAFE